VHALDVRGRLFESDAAVNEAVQFNRLLAAKPARLTTFALTRARRALPLSYETAGTRDLVKEA